MFFLIVLLLSVSLFVSYIQLYKYVLLLDCVRNVVLYSNVAYCCSACSVVYSHLCGQCEQKGNDQLTSDPKQGLSCTCYEF